MKKFNLSKELLLNGVLIGVLSIGLVSCGSGGGGGSGSTSLSFGGSSPSTPISFSTSLYAADPGYPINEPIITVYIDGKPVQLIADTGHSGLVVSSSAVNIPSSDIDSSYSFGDSFDGGIFGVMASATVCLNPSITNSCVVMPMCVMTSYNGIFTGEVQGNFGLASGLNSLDIGYNSSSSSIVGLSYPTYLERQYGINSYTISFYPLSNGFYSDVSSTTPIGYISFGVYNGNSNTLIPYTMNSSGMPSTTVIFSSSNSSTPSFTDYAVFNSGYPYNIFSTSVFQTEIPNFSQTADEGACANYGWSVNLVNGGYVISYSLQNYSGSFTTEPSLSFCETNPLTYPPPLTLMEGITWDYGQPLLGETFGLAAMLGHTFTWVLSTSGTNQGFVQGISINP